MRPVRLFASSRRPRRQCRPCLEHLESRCQPSTLNPVPGPANPDPPAALPSAAAATAPPATPLFPAQIPNYFMEFGESPSTGGQVMTQPGYVTLNPVYFNFTELVLTDTAPPAGPENPITTPTKLPTSYALQHTVNPVNGTVPDFALQQNRTAGVLESRAFLADSPVFIGNKGVANMGALVQEDLGIPEPKQGPNNNALPPLPPSVPNPQSKEQHQQNLEQRQEKDEPRQRNMEQPPNPSIGPIQPWKDNRAIPKGLFGVPPLGVTRVDLPREQDLVPPTGTFSTTMTENAYRVLPDEDPVGQHEKEVEPVGALAACLLAVVPEWLPPDSREQARCQGNRAVLELPGASP